MIDIIVTDINNNRPVMNPDQYDIEMPESLEIGTSVLTVFAYDEDIGENAKLEFSLQGNTDDKFYIDSIYAAQTGVIKILEVSVS